MTSRVDLGPDDIAVLVEDMSRLNDQHTDSVLFVARHLGAHPDAFDAQIVEVSTHGVTVRLTDPAGTRRVDIEFSNEAETVDEIRAGMYELVVRSRRLAPAETPLTSVEREYEGLRGLETFATTVHRVRDVNSRFREITFRGGLDAFRPIGPDQFLLLTVPATEREDGTPVRAYYTVRRWRPDLGEMDMWFVRHDHPSSVSGWAARAVDGDPVTMWGPRASFEPPVCADHLMLVADESGLPAIAAILEERSRAQRASVLIEVGEARDIVDLDLRDGDDMQWVFRGDAPAGSDARLVEAVSALRFEPESTYAFGAAESRQITAVRTHLRREMGMPRTHVQMTGYWRRRQ